MLDLHMFPPLSVNRGGSFLQRRADGEGNGAGEATVRRPAEIQNVKLTCWAWKRIQVLKKKRERKKANEVEVSSAA